MKIAIIGYGKMGKVIEAQALKDGHEIVAIIDSEYDWINHGKKLDAASVAIEFSEPRAAIENILKCIKIRLPVVCGTTGWDKYLTAMKAQCDANNAAVFVAPNFSIGVNIFFMLNRYLATLMNKVEDYEIAVNETHHTQKLDAPSGTAIALADDLIKTIDRKQQWVSGQAKSDEELAVISHRIAQVTGIHNVTCSSAHDQIEVKHTSKNREGFAKGALLAASWLNEKKGFFTMEHLMAEILEYTPYKTNQHKTG